MLYVLAAGVALGTLGPVSNVAYGAGMGSPTFAALRATVGALVLLALAGRDERRVSLRSLSRREQALLAMTAGAQACLSLALFAAYGAMSVALVLAVYFSYPLLVCAASIALGRERLTPVRAAALLLSLAGLLVVVLGRSGPEVHASAMGLALAAVAACCQATYLVASRNGFTRVPSTQAVTVILVGAALVIWAVALPVDGTAGRLLAWVSDPAAWLAILFAGVVGAGLAKVWLLRGVRRVGGTRSSVLMLVEPITGVALAAVLLGQPFGAPELLGGAAILVGAMLAQRPAAVARAEGRSPAERAIARDDRHRRALRGMSVASTHRRLLLAVLAGVLMLSASETPRPTQAVVAPTCAVGDTLTRYRATSDWYRSLLDTRFRLPRAYAPGGPRERLARGRVRLRADPARRARRLHRDGPRREGGAARRSRSSPRTGATARRSRRSGAGCAPWATGERCWRPRGRATRSTSWEPPSTSRRPAAPRPGPTRTGAGRGPEPGSPATAGATAGS